MSPTWESEYGVLGQGVLAKIEICDNDCILRSHGAHTLSKYDERHGESSQINVTSSDHQEYNKTLALSLVYFRKSLKKKMRDIFY